MKDELSEETIQYDSRKALIVPINSKRQILIQDRRGQQPGILHIPSRQFALTALGIVIVWNTFWGTLVYSLGEAALTIVGFKFIITTVALWIVYEVLKSVWMKYKT